MATAETVIKPDFATRRRHFIFTDEHEQPQIRALARFENDALDAMARPTPSGARLHPVMDAG